MKTMNQIVGENLKKTRELSGFYAGAGSEIYRCGAVGL